MTDGTSQGLFVVVAIVIFGIFVALSYTVFGSDGLSGGIERLTEQALNDTEVRVKNWKYIRSIDSKRVVQNLPHAGDFRRRVYFEKELFEKDGEYTMVFDLTLNEGQFTHLGGHYPMGISSEIFVDGEHYTPENTGLENPWQRGLELPQPLEIGETISVQVNFDAKILDNPSHPDTRFRISPNRNTSNNVFDITVSNLKIYKTN